MKPRFQGHQIRLSGVDQSITHGPSGDGIQPHSLLLLLDTSTLGAAWLWTAIVSPRPGKYCSAHKVGTNTTNNIITVSCALVLYEHVYQVLACDCIARDCTIVSSSIYPACRTGCKPEDPWSTFRFFRCPRLHCCWLHPQPRLRPSVQSAHERESCGPLLHQFLLLPSS